MGGVGLGRSPLPALPLRLALGTTPRERLLNRFSSPHHPTRFVLASRFHSCPPSPPGAGVKQTVFETDEWLDGL